MPAKSKAQFRMMKGVCEGGIAERPDLPPKEVACEYIEGQSPKGLPEKFTGNPTFIYDLFLYFKSGLTPRWWF